MNKSNSKICEEFYKASLEYSKPRELTALEKVERRIKVREYYASGKRKEYFEKRKKDPDAIKAVSISNVKKRQRNIVKYKARDFLNVKVKRGDIIKPTTCELKQLDDKYICNGRIEAHHKDYSRPLDVDWFCRKHHNLADRFVINAT